MSVVGCSIRSRSATNGGQDILIGERVKQSTAGGVSDVSPSGNDFEFCLHLKITFDCEVTEFFPVPTHHAPNPPAAGLAAAGAAAMTGSRGRIRGARGRVRKVSGEDPKGNGASAADNQSPIKNLEMPCLKDLW